MSGDRQIKFEVYAMQGGRWNIHTHFDANYRDDAVEEAMRVERQSGIAAACVMRSSYNIISNESTDTVIYHSPSLNSRPTASNLSRGGGRARGAVLSPSGELLPPPGSAAANAAADYDRRDQEFQARQRAESMRGSKAFTGHVDGIPDFVDPYEEDGDGIDFMRLSIAFMTSSMVATATAGAVYLVLRAVELNVGGSIMLWTLASTFGGSFLVFFIPMVRKILDAGKKSKRPVQNDLSAETGFIMQEDSFVLEEPVEQFDLPVMEEKIADSLPEAEIIPIEELTAELTEILKEEIEEDGLDNTPEDEEDFSEKILESIPKDGPVETETPVVEKPNDVKEEIVDTKSEDDRLAQVLSVLVKEAKSHYGTTIADEAFLRFGAILFLAGSAEFVAREQGISKVDFLKVLVKSVVIFGVEKSHARGFCKNIDEYLLDERYAGMYNAGRNAGRAKIKSLEAKSGFIDWLEYWKNPAVQAAQSAIIPQTGVPAGKRFVAVVFTDIVDSTSHQQEIGDEGMMTVLRSHNKIVRTAVKNYGGREVKHLGDGIMATFPAVAEAVAACITMQQGFNQEAKAKPDYAYEVRIGISAGEPIHESGDVFGTPVNLAARVMDKAGAGQIVVSESVKEMCADKSFQFREGGEVKLKGFSEDQLIFYVNLP